MRLLQINPSGWPMSVEECPPGFFVYEDQLCFKTEYCAMIPDRDDPTEKTWLVGSAPDIYNSAGEHMHIHESTIIQPVDYEWVEEETV